jgi:peptide/nickel transport system substrate-binding protein
VLGIEPVAAEPGASSLDGSIDDLPYNASAGVLLNGASSRSVYALSAFVLALAACGPSSVTAFPTSATPIQTQAASDRAVGVEPSSTSGPATARAAGGTLRLVWWQAPTILNPHLAQSTKDYDAARMVLEPLAAITRDGSYVPVLAAEIPSLANGGISADLRTTTWKLKPGVKWSDGTDFTAADAVFNWQYMADKDTASTDAKTVVGIDRVEATAPTTVVITWRAPNPNPFQVFTGALGLIIQKAQFQAYLGTHANDAPGNLKPIGTGPYKVRDFKPGDVVTYDANEYYRDPAKPFFKGAELKGGGDAVSAGRAVLQVGDADYAWNLQVEATILSQLLQGGKGDLVTLDSQNVERILLNFADPNAPGDARSEPSTQHPFLTDLNVRKALAMAVDRDAIANQLYGGGLIGTPTCNILTAPPDVVSPNTQGMDVCRHDVGRANELLDAAGWTRGAGGVRQKDGVRMHIVFQTSTSTLRQKEQDIIKQGWAQLGVETELKSVDAGIMFSSDPGNRDTAAHFFSDVEMFTNGSDLPEPTTWLHDFTTEAIAQKSNEWRLNNYQRWSNASYDATWQELNAETDPGKRAELAIKLNDVLVENVVDIALVARKWPVAAKSKSLQGVDPSPWDSELWNVADWSKTTV